ncbi:hypothetical protein GCM10007924_21140 [Sneathiella chinensis]|uniref:Dicarboxylate transport domain-containing protein n=2 Tax=Sneathiella chinensis TaxID=349750 RepID=A0ABQ5U4Y5_9PROT|nr:hypothetical protein GCM10007924_21140 [Sneathiella chinensis]
MAGAGLYGFRVPLAERGLAYHLKSLGFDQPSFQVTSIETDGAVIEDVILGPDLSAGRLAVKYHLAGLLSGQVDGVTIDRLNADLSDPEGGALSVLMGFAETDAASDTGNESPLTIPPISVTDARIKAALGPTGLDAVLNGTLDAAGALAARVQVNATHEEGGQGIALDGLDLSVAGSLPETRLDIRIEDGKLVHRADLPAWPPVPLTGTVSLNPERADFSLAAALQEGSHALKLQGFHDLVGGAGQGNLTVTDFVFQKTGLRPGDLSPYLADLPPLDAALSARAHAGWSGEGLTLTSDLEVTGLSVEGEGYTAASERIALSATGQYDFASGDHHLAVRGQDLAGLLIMNEDRITVKNGELAVRIREFGQQITVETLSVSVSDPIAKPLFPPLLLTATAALTEDGAKAEGRVTGRDDEVTLAYDLQSERAFSRVDITGKLDPLTVGRGGITPEKLSRLLSALPAGTGGTVAGDVALVWNRAAGNLTGTVNWSGRDMVVKQQDIRISGLSLSGNVDISESGYSGRVRDVTGRVDAGPRQASFKGGQAQYQLDTDFKNGTVDLVGMQVTAGKGLFLKPPVTLAGNAQLRSGTLAVNGGLTTLLLGEMVRFDGKADLDRGQGRIRLTVADIPFEKGGVQPADLVHGLGTEVEASGFLGGAAELVWSGDTVTTSGSLNLDTVSLKMEGMEATGITGRIRLDSLMPLTVSTPQEISADRLVAAAVFDRPLLRFRVATPQDAPVLFVDYLRTGLVGGMAEIRDAKLDTAAAVNRVTVELSALDLEQVMAMGNIPDVTATGRLSGSLPLEFDGDKLTISLGELTALEPGHLQVHSAEARQALAGGGDQTKLLFDILENFNYTELSIAIQKPPTGEDKVSLHIKGGNPDVENNRPVVLNINVETDLDKILGTVLDGYRLSEQALRATVGKKRQ